MRKVLLLSCIGVILTACGPQPMIRGMDGRDGKDGKDGQDSHPVQMVKFCPQETRYPASFPEYGFCVEGKLYATYYDTKNAWTAEIVPGLYMSTSTNAPCNFMVYDNCRIEYK